MESFLYKTNGQLNPDQPDRNEMVVSVLRTVKFMIQHGFYVESTELEKIAIPVMQLLNGAN